MAQVIDTSLADDNEAQSTLFNGSKFWLSRKVPQRSRFIADIKANGGEVVSTEKQADLLIVDHAKKEALPGTYSYQFIEKSIRNGKLERLSDHAVGTPVGSTVRAVGSSTQPAKTTRQKFTQEDDQILLNWVESSRRKGAKTDGNEIFKQLEAKNQRHPWQSWRDRWVKHLKETCRTAMSDEGSRDSSPDELEGSGAKEDTKIGFSEDDMNRLLESGAKEDTKIGFSDDDMNLLLEIGEHIHAIPSENVAKAWEAWALEHDERRRTAQEWQDFWEETVRPKYLENAQRSRKSPVFDNTNLHLFVRLRPQSPGVPPASGSISPGSRSIGISQEPQAHSPRSPEIFYPAVETPTHDSLSPKRKRAASEEHFPSNSPPYLEPFNKRQRRQGSMPAEIAPTPEQSPIHHNDFSPSAFKSPNAEEFVGSRYEVENEVVSDGQDEMRGNDEENEHLVLNGNKNKSVDEDSVQEEDEDEEKFLGRQASPVLLELNHKPVGTQTSRNESTTPFIDFDVAPPQDGWDESPSGSSKSSPSLPSFQAPVQVHPDSKTNNIDTIEETQTLLPDFSIPSPDGGWDTFELSPLPLSPTQSEIPELLDAWIDGHIASGFSSVDVIAALEYTSLDNELAEQVLAHMKHNQGAIPKDMPGVWTESDDENFQSTDAQRNREMERKHGSENMEKRWSYLNECKELKRAAEGNQV